jgi:hypothetical protein
MSDKPKFPRKLSEILSADVKGYSILMADVEAHAIQSLKVYQQIISYLISEYSRHVFKGISIKGVIKEALNHCWQLVTGFFSDSKAYLT